MVDTNLAFRAIPAIAVRCSKAEEDKLDRLVGTQAALEMLEPFDRNDMRSFKVSKRNQDDDDGTGMPRSVSTKTKKKARTIHSNLITIYRG